MFLVGISLLVRGCKHQLLAGGGGQGSFCLEISSLTKGNTQTSKEPGSRSHGRVLFTGFPFMTCSAHLLPEPRTTIPGVTPPTVSWDFGHQPEESSQEKRPQSFFHRPIWWWHFLNRTSLFPNDSCLYKVDTNLAKTEPSSYSMYIKIRE